MQAQSITVAPALRALLNGFIDYAGIFPPANLSVTEAVANYSDYRGGKYAWMLRWLVVDAANLSSVPEQLNNALAILSQFDNERAATLETKTVVPAKRPVYCEISLDNLSALDGIKQSGCYGKIRMGGLKPEAIPSSTQVASFIEACAQRRLAFKATAGLHHPIRKEHALTYDQDAPRAIMHGFVNVLMAAAFAWHGDKQIRIESIINEIDADAFSFDEDAHWRNHTLSAAMVQDARQNFIHSVGSCSFEEPIHDLKELGLL